MDNTRNFCIIAHIDHGKSTLADRLIQLTGGLSEREMRDALKRICDDLDIEARIGGVADDLALMEWLENYIFPAEVEFVDAEFVRIGTELACWEMIRGGTTTFVDMYYFPDTIAEVVESCCMRALVSATVIERPSPGASNAADSLAKGVALLKEAGIMESPGDMFWA